MGAEARNFGLCEAKSKTRVDKADVVCLGVLVKLLLLQYKLHAQFQHLHSRAPQLLHSRGRLTPVLQLLN